MSGTSDWHRVERALAMFRSEVSELTERGWQIVTPKRVLERLVICG